MQGTMYQEIKSFYDQVRNEGIYWPDYLQKKKYFKNKIDDKADNLLILNKYLWLNKKITKKQYTMMKTKIEYSRSYYKRLLSYC